MNINEIIAENERRKARLAVGAYDQLTGEGCCGKRVQCGALWLPEAMVQEHPDWATLDEMELNRLRVHYDFEFWAATCCTIKDKQSSDYMKLLLNRPQRRMLREMEEKRQAGKPVRIILLKARQWGGSTLVQMYMAWIQLCVHKRWNSLICGHVHQSSAVIMRMYDIMLSNYPEEYLDSDTRPVFRSLKGTSNVQQLRERDCLVINGSALSEDAVRGYDLAMAHLTEVAFWKKTLMHDPLDVVRSVSGTVGRLADTVVVYESSANGVGNFFHNEWLRAQAGDSDKVAIFVPWYEIDFHSSKVDDVAKLWESLNDYERKLWENENITLENLQWYHDTRRDCSKETVMMSEFPTTDIEAFTCNGNNVFETEVLGDFSTHVTMSYMTGEVADDDKGNVKFYTQANGGMKVWRQPDPNAPPKRYMVVVDVGGRSARADYSVAMVMDTHGPKSDKLPELVAQWRGHIDHDLLAEKVVQIARYYRNARLVIESNSLETENTDPDAGEFILNTIGSRYRHMYQRDNGKYGFQTNRRTKQKAVYALIRAVREKQYVERDQEAINEMATYEQRECGRFGARDGCHDDIVMTRAIAMAVLDEERRKHISTVADTPIDTFL